MTTKDLSRELCEICGIEAKQFTKDFKTRKKAASFGRKITGIPKFRGNKFDIGSYTDNQSIYQVHWKEFPDFTQPENFVKLFELDIPDTTVTVGAAVCFCNRQQLNNRNDFLEAAIQQAKYNKDIKQAIKSEVWKYD